MDNIWSISYYYNRSFHIKRYYGDKNKKSMVKYVWKVIITAGLAGGYDFLYLFWLAVHNVSSKTIVLK